MNEGSLSIWSNPWKSVSWPYFSIVRAENKYEHCFLGGKNHNELNFYQRGHDFIAGIWNIACIDVHVQIFSWFVENLNIYYFQSLEYRWKSAKKISHDMVDKSSILIFSLKSSVHTYRNFFVFFDKPKNPLG